MNDWYPISPHVDGNGELRALRGLTAAGAKPTPAPPDHVHFTDSDESYSDLELGSASSLGITAVGSFAANLSSKVLVFDRMVFSTVRATGSPVQATRWGAAIRLTVRIEQTKGSIELNLATVAAASELDVVRASFEVVGLGITNPYLLSKIPGPGRFDRGSFGAVSDVMRTFKNRYSHLKTIQAELKPLPLWVDLDRPPRASVLDEAAATVAVVRLLAERNTLQHAITRLESHVAPEHVAKIYAEVGGVIDPADYAGWGARRAAKKWLAP